jgi:cytidylate kinase
VHITLTGNLGSGKSTVCKLLSGHGFEIYSTGAIFRAIAQRLGLTALGINELAGTQHDIDHEVDREVTRVATLRPRDKLVFDSRMAWHFVPSSVKVFLKIDPEEGARRVFADQTRGAVEHYGSLEEAAAMLAARTREERERYIALYGKDYLDMSNYDLVIDSTRQTPEENFAAILEAWEATL